MKIALCRRSPTPWQRFFLFSFFSLFSLYSCFSFFMLMISHFSISNAHSFSWSFCSVLFFFITMLFIPFFLCFGLPSSVCLLHDLVQNFVVSSFLLHQLSSVLSRNIFCWELGPYSFFHSSYQSVLAMYKNKFDFSALSWFVLFARSSFSEASSFVVA